MPCNMKLTVFFVCAFFVFVFVFILLLLLNTSLVALLINEELQKKNENLVF